MSEINEYQQQMTIVRRKQMSRVSIMLKRDVFAPVDD